MNTGRLAGRFALVTGASRGIGRGVAVRFAAEGATVAINHADDAEGAEGTLAAIRAAGPPDAAYRIVQADVADPAAVDRMIADTVAAWGRLDVLVNNAGIGAAPKDGYDKFYERMGAMNEQLARGETPTVHLDHIIDMQDEGWQKVVDININGVFYNCREAVRLMISCGARGSIINISSTSALNGTGAVHYSASKAAVLGLTKSLARELGGRGIRVNAICPGATNTRMMAGISPDYAKQMVASIPLGRMGEPQEVANTALFLASEEGSYFTGQTLAANGGWQML
jgi:3-oxoacyl-[acyl-carrier protein] reductase